MRKIFFLILLCILLFLLYWFRGYFWTYFLGNTQSSQESYSILLENSLSRVEKDARSESVIFSQEDMESGNGDTNI